MASAIRIVIIVAAAAGALMRARREWLVPSFGRPELESAQWPAHGVRLAPQRP